MRARLLRRAPHRRHLRPGLGVPGDLQCSHPTQNYTLLPLQSSVCRGEALSLPAATFPHLLLAVAALLLGLLCLPIYWGAPGTRWRAPAATRVTITTIRQGAVQQLPLHLGQAAERGGGVQGRGVEAEDAVCAGAAEDGGHTHQEVAAQHC